MRKAEAALTSARVLLSTGDADGACNRAYYAMFDAAHAALRAAKIELPESPIKTHSGLVAMFGLHLVRANQLAAEHGVALNKVQNLRELADYSGDPVTLENATWAVAQAEAFVNAIRETFSFGGV